ncbi:MAG: hypothetical protein BWZ00_01756 [Bacteroidetes bacterium ADurb.BinA174]|nr:MAG: hypothetical protein BWZ00_01756 [Bacteroidetes bacterium ADurb.BinA174]
MPRFNQQGPMGEGPMTGRKMGKCTNYGENNSSAEQQVNENVDRGGRGFGMRGCRRGFQDNDGQGQGRGFGRGRGRSVQGQGRRRRGFSE